MQGTPVDSDASLVSVEERQQGAGLLGRVLERHSSRKVTVTQMGNPQAKVGVSHISQE